LSYKSPFVIIFKLPENKPNLCHSLLKDGETTRLKIEIYRVIGFFSIIIRLVLKNFILFSLFLEIFNNAGGPSGAAVPKQAWKGSIRADRLSSLLRLKYQISPPACRAAGEFCHERHEPHEPWPGTSPDTGNLG
jgi:hypothetical protein